MENNKLILMEDGKEVEYNILLNIEDANGKNYLVYKLNEENGSIKLISIKDDKEWEFVKDIINSIDNEE